MRSLRSNQKAKTNVKTKKNNNKDENSPSEMCMKPTRSGKRQVLADKTNSSSERNRSTSDSETSKCFARPKRQHNLPARFLGHELSPLSYKKRLTPEFSSTPIPLKTSKRTDVNKNTRTNTKNITLTPEKIETPTKQPINNKKTNKNMQIIPEPVSTTPSKKNTSLNIGDKLSEKSSPPGAAPKSTLPVYKKKVSPVSKSDIATPERLALYDFDFDPTEEPAKPKKKPVKRNAAPRKKKALPGSQGDDINGAMKLLVEQLKKIQAATALKKLKKIAAQKKNEPKNNEHLILTEVAIHSGTDKTHSATPIVIQQKQLTKDDCGERRSPSPCGSISYSPPPSPILTPSKQTATSSLDKTHLRNITSDVNNAAARMSLFNDEPIASSSMIHPLENKPAASPWRINYDVEVKKWAYNFYVKPSMTPAYERDTFHVLGLDDNNVAEDRVSSVNVPETSDCQTNENEKNYQNWKQTSILSFYAESMKKQAKKIRPTKKSVPEFNLEELLANSPPEKLHEEPPAAVTPVESPKPIVSKKSPKSKDKSALDDCFGFDDSSYDQENISPVPKIISNINTIRGGGLKRKAAIVGVLKELNRPAETLSKVPTRVAPSVITSIVKRKKNMILQEIEPPKEITPVALDSDESSTDKTQEETTLDSSEQSINKVENEVALFEDPIEPVLVHFSKVTRRSYERRKRPNVKFAEMEDTVEHNYTEDDTDDDSESPQLAKQKSKKVIKKKRKENVKTLLEKKEADQWAAGFNSMLEEADDFALCIE